MVVNSSHQEAPSTILESWDVVLLPEKCLGRKKNILGLPRMHTRRVPIAIQSFALQEETMSIKPFTSHNLCENNGHPVVSSSLERFLVYNYTRLLLVCPLLRCMSSFEVSFIEGKISLYSPLYGQGHPSGHYANYSDL